jgi:hypothetical protein
MKCGIRNAECGIKIKVKTCNINIVLKFIPHSEFRIPNFKENLI